MKKNIIIAFLAIILGTIAVRLLTEQKINITQVAYSVGYSSQPSFSAAFRKHFGVSPTEYISQHK